MKYTGRYSSNYHIRMMESGTLSVVTTIPLLQYKPGDLGLVPAGKPSLSPTVLQKLGKVRTATLLCITIIIIIY